MIQSTPLLQPHVNALSIEHLHLSYGSKKILHNVNLSFPKSQVSGIVGPSGCGKSSLLSCINRLIEIEPQAQFSGAIHFENINILDPTIDIRSIRKKIGLVFQDPTPLPISIIANVELALKEHKFNHPRERAVAALKSVGLWDEVHDKLNQSALRLSGGQKQRLSIARTIALEPQIILMDEPCASLDPISTEKIEQLIMNLKGHYTIIIVTHNLAQARRICDYLSICWYDPSIESGYVVEHGCCNDLFEKPRHAIVREYLLGKKG